MGLGAEWGLGDLRVECGPLVEILFVGRGKCGFGSSGGWFVAFALELICTWRGVSMGIVK